mmetsp:Transcript_22977/g.39082  ORF Transcript_22977/g.39082 Transcript_22977/m.39082 type:complete len:97 (-) Transcript_22977:207-497(-)
MSFSLNSILAALSSLKRYTTAIARSIAFLREVADPAKLRLRLKNSKRVNVRWMSRRETTELERLTASSLGSIEEMVEELSNNLFVMCFIAKCLMAC